MHLLSVDDSSNNLSTFMQGSGPFFFRHLKYLLQLDLDLVVPNLWFNIAAYYTCILFVPFLLSNKEIESARIKKTGEETYIM